MINDVKLILGISDSSKDSLLTLLIEQCEQYLLDFTHREDSDGLEYIIVQMVVERFNKIGSEGISNKSYSGISETPLEDFSQPLVKLLKSKRKIRTV